MRPHTPAGAGHCAGAGSAETSGDEGDSSSGEEEHSEEHDEEADVHAVESMLGCPRCDCRRVRGGAGWPGQWNLLAAVQRVRVRGPAHGRVRLRRPPPPHCAGLQGGCTSCRAHPMVQRPYARWRPEEGHPQDHLPEAPTFRWEHCCAASMCGAPMGPVVASAATAVQRLSGGERLGTLALRLAHAGVVRHAAGEACRPTEDEWDDPYAYIASIYPEASKTGAPRPVCGRVLQLRACGMGGWCRPRMLRRGRRGAATPRPRPMQQRVSVPRGPPSGTGG
jgi:hypothetical protein